MLAINHRLAPDTAFAPIEDAIAHAGCSIRDQPGIAFAGIPRKFALAAMLSLREQRSLSPRAC